MRYPLDLFTRRVTLEDVRAFILKRMDHVNDLMCGTSNRLLLDRLGGEFDALALVAEQVGKMIQELQA